jgi:hypothetical protein
MSNSKGPRESVSTNGGNEVEYGTTFCLAWRWTPTLKKAWQLDVALASCDAGGVVVVGVHAANAFGVPEPIRTMARATEPTAMTQRPIRATGIRRSCLDAGFAKLSLGT